MLEYGAGVVRCTVAPKEEEEGKEGGFGAPPREGRRVGAKEEALLSCGIEEEERKDVLGGCDGTEVGNESDESDIEGTDMLKRLSAILAGAGGDTEEEKEAEAEAKIDGVGAAWLGVGADGRLGYEAEGEELAGILSGRDDEGEAVEVVG